MYSGAGSRVYFRGEGCRPAQVRLPEFREVGRFGGVRPYFVGAEPHFHVVGVFLSVDVGRQPQVAESRFPARAHVDGGLAPLHGGLAVGVVGQAVASDGVFYRGVARYAVFIELYVDDGLFAHLVRPVVMVGHGHPQVVAVFRVVLCCPGVGQCDDGQQRGDDGFLHSWF